MQVSGKASQSVSHVKRSHVIQPRIGVVALDALLLEPAVACSRNGSAASNGIDDGRHPVTVNEQDKG